MPISEHFTPISETLKVPVSSPLAAEFSPRQSPVELGIFMTKSNTHFNAFPVFLHQSLNSFLSPRQEMACSPFHIIRTEEQRGTSPYNLFPIHWTLDLGWKQWIKPKGNKHLPYLLQNIIARVSCSLTACFAHVVFQPPTLLSQKKKKEKEKTTSILPTTILLNNNSEEFYHLFLPWSCTVCSTDTFA